MKPQTLDTPVAGLNLHPHLSPDHPRQRMQRSFACAVVALTSVALMIYLVDTHRPADPLKTGDYFPFLKVVITLSAAAISASLATILAIPVVMSGSWKPALWLIPMAAGLLLFFATYDWAGLFLQGRPSL